jgi:ribosomal protein S3
MIRTARPGIVIGRKGAEIEKLKTELQKRTNRDVFIDIIEVNKPELDAQLVSGKHRAATGEARGLPAGDAQSVDSALRFGCKGIKVRVSGRLNGNEIARSEWYLQGRLPLHTLRADIDYGFTEANTTYGVIGVKTWIYRGDIYEQKRRQLRRWEVGVLANSGQCTGYRFAGKFSCCSWRERLLGILVQLVAVFEGFRYVDAKESEVPQAAEGRMRGKAWRGSSCRSANTG